MKHKILIIEDEMNLRENIIEILSFKGFDVSFAVNGKDGVFKAIEVKPDLILCDIMMPEMDGYDVLRYVRQNKVINSTPFIFLTAMTERKDSRKGMSLGADDYLTKPFTTEDLVNAINTRLTRSKQVESDINNKVNSFIKSINATSQHEFNTPLNGILGLSELLLTYFQNFDEDEIKRIIGEIHGAGKRLHRTVSNFLFYYYLESVKLDDEKKEAFKKGSTNIEPSIVQNIADKINESQKGKLFFDIAIESTTLDVNESHVLKILEELLDNACKFAIDNSTISIKGSVIDETYSFQVTNFGRGMKNEHISQIGPFKQFERKQYEQQGSGLGLYLVKTILELYSSSFKVQSEYGKSTTVSITIPIMK